MAAAAAGAVGDNDLTPTMATFTCSEHDGKDSMAEAQLRMKGALDWVEDCEPALGWEPGTFRRLYRANLVLGSERVVDADRVLTALEEFMLAQTEWPEEPGIRRWEGTAKELLQHLGSLVGAAATRGRDWPKAANALSQKLCGEVAPALEKQGITVKRGSRRHGGTRSLTIRHTQKIAGPPEEEKPSSPPPPEPVVAAQEVEMQSQTTENAKHAGDDHGGGQGDDAKTASPRRRRSISSPPPSSPPASPRKTPGKRPVSSEKKADGDDGDADFLSLGGKKISACVSPDPALASGPGGAVPDPAPGAQPDVVQPSSAPGVRPLVRRVF